VHGTTRYRAGVDDDTRPPPVAVPHGVEDDLRRAGLRLTAPRRRVLAALARRGHATPEEVAGEVSGDGGGRLPASTIYRNLESLASAGVVRHSHLDHGAPSYHLAEHGDHLHLVCRGCGTVLEADPALAADLAAGLRALHGFAADVTHMAIHGHCERCLPRA
jgi:Fur family transcriptional regulator, ferric uptake regulator